MVLRRTLSGSLRVDEPVCDLYADERKRKTATRQPVNALRRPRAVSNVWRAHTYDLWRRWRRLVSRTPPNRPTMLQITIANTSNKAQAKLTVKIRLKSIRNWTQLLRASVQLQGLKDRLNRCEIYRVGQKVAPITTTSI